MANKPGKKAVILLLYSSNPHLEQLKEALIVFCKNHNFPIIEIIIAENEHDDKAFFQLIQTVSKQNTPNNPINLIAHKSSFKELSHLLSWTIIGTLLEAKLINKLYIYQQDITGNSKKDETGRFIKTDSHLLNLCFLYFECLLMSSTDITMYGDDEEN
jgi:hypothetical protein